MMMTTGEYLIEQLQAKNIDTSTAILNPYPWTQARRSKEPNSALASDVYRC